MKKAIRVPANLRHTAILTELKNRGHATVADLSEWLGVTDMTIRRDLDAIELSGAIERTHGGAHIPDAMQRRALELLEPSLEHRARSSRSEKKLIAKEALTLISPERSVALDIGTTVFELAALIMPPAPWIMTGSLPILRVLAERQLHISVPCGTLRGREPSVSGAQAVTYLQDFIFDISFFGLAGLTVDGLYDFSADDSEVKKVMIKQSKLRVFLADHTKFGILSAVRFGALDEVDILITDRAPPDDLRGCLTEAGVEIRIAGT